MKYKTLVMKQIDKHTYQYSMNAPLDNLSPILSFDEEMLNVNYGNELEYALNCAKRREVLKDGFLLEPKDNMTLTEWAPFLALSLVLQYYKSYRNLPPILMSVDKEMQEKSENVYLLHSRYIRRDRAFLEKQIMDFAESEEAGIWITTQIVEASLDIDFDVLHTEMCTADSLLQRMGRCNRKGRYFPEEANVIIYDNRNGVGKNSIYDSVMYDRSLKLLAQYENLEFVESMKTTYMNQVYDSDEIKGTGYYEEIEKCLNKLSKIHPVDYKLKDAEIRKINSVTVVPEEIYQEKMDLFECGTDFLRKI